MQEKEGRKGSFLNVIHLVTFYCKISDSVHHSLLKRKLKIFFICVYFIIYIFMYLFYFLLVWGIDTTIHPSIPPISFSDGIKTDLL